MYYNKLCVVICSFLLLYGVVEGKKKRISKRPKPEEEENAPQPDVVSYSTFGFNDVGTYEGFVPSSPDYAKFLSGANQDPSTKQQESYPTSVDSPPYGDHNFAASQNSFTVSNDGNSQPGALQYSQNTNGFYNSPSFGSENEQYKKSNENSYSNNKEDVNSPVYGTKLSSRGRVKYPTPPTQYNHSEVDEVKIVPNENKNFYNFHEPQQQQFDNTQSQGEHNNSFQNFPLYPTTSTDYGNAALGDAVKFPRVVDFTKMRPFYNELDTSQLPLATPNTDIVTSNTETSDNSNSYSNTQTDNGNKYFHSGVSFKTQFDQKQNNEEVTEKNFPKYNPYTQKENVYNNYGGDNKFNVQEIKPNSEKSKKKPWSSVSYDYKKWKDQPISSLNGYEFSTNYSKQSFKYDVSEPKKPNFNPNYDEIVSAGSNLDTPSYQFPETIDFTGFKKMPSYKVHEEENEFDKFPSFKDSIKSNQPDYNQFKNLFTTSPTLSSYWGNVFPSSEFTSYKSHPKKNPTNHFNSDEVVNIPRRPNKWNYEREYENKPSEWSQYNRRPSKSKPWKDWTKPVTNRFKPEEALLDLRNQDTSHPSHLPTYHSSNYISDDGDYKKLVDKWRQSYLKSKYKDSLRDYESYPTESKPLHVPVPKPYTIEIPHPVIVPVPQPYPVRVPVAKPVAVPVVHELTIPIEKPVPYPVIKKVPYPIEKPVPVPVEKEVAVPVMKPYPVHVPHVRPVFHHTKSRDEDFRDDDDYFPRHENNKKVVQYRKKKPQSSRDRVRRPSRTVYQDRNRRRWPDRKRPGVTEQRKRPPPQYSSSKHRDYDPEAYEEERYDYNRY